MVIISSNQITLLQGPHRHISIATSIPADVSDIDVFWKTMEGERVSELNATQTWMII